MRLTRTATTAAIGDSVTVPPPNVSSPITIEKKAYALPASRSVINMGQVAASLPHPARRRRHDTSVKGHFEDGGHALNKLSERQLALNATTLARYVCAASHVIPDDGANSARFGAAKGQAGDRQRRNANV
jgi:hypothetical protein